MARHKKHFVGSTFWIIFWIIFFFPIAIIYWVVRQEELSEKELKKLEERSWIKKHKIFSGIMAFFLLLIGMSLLASVVDPDSTNNNLEEGKLISADSASLLPQDAEIDRIWRINNITSIITNATGFIEGTERQINKAENLESTRVTARAYRFDSEENAYNFYDQRKGEIDVRGIEEWNLGNSCFGVKKDVVLSGYSKGFCVRNNIVLYMESVSSSYSYTNDGKFFMNIMIKKV